MWAELTYFSEDLSSTKYRDLSKEIENKFGVRCKVITAPEAVGIKVTLRLETPENIHYPLRNICFRDIGFPASIECDDKTRSIIDELRHKQMEKVTGHANAALTYGSRLKQSLSR